MLTLDQRLQVDDALKLAASVFGTPGTTLDNLKDAARFLRLKCCDKPNEELGVVWMDSRYNVLSVETLGLGTVDCVEVKPRRMITSALAVNAAHAILYHNHPSGDSEPSDQDEEATKLWGDLLGVIGCTVLDHLVIGRDVFSIHKGHVIR
jgi:DNA repair protein RadC